MSATVVSRRRAAKRPEKSVAERIEKVVALASAPSGEERGPVLLQVDIKDGKILVDRLHELYGPWG